ncbi:MAG: glycosyltransferase [Microscillaceae bacterium]|nr:glycosyltransferase [Microscillaceae bacterium]
MNEIGLLGGIWFLAFGLQLFFHLGIFAPLIFYRPRLLSHLSPLPSVSVVICARNEALHLPNLLGKLRAQNHPDFEVILVDDRSEDSTPGILSQWQQNWPALQVKRIEKTPPAFDPKKYALGQGLAQAQKEVIVLTDADGYPASEEWLTLLAQCFEENTEVVLGLSPYEKRPGLLNAFIQFETFYTALQYLGLARAGWPYMGLGRNLAYRRALYLENQEITRKYQHITGGDDDLWISNVAHKKNTQICLNPQAYVISYPKLRWKNGLPKRKDIYPLANITSPSPSGF